MTLDEAKFILQAYRTDLNPAGVPNAEAALKLLEANEELQHWLDEETAFDEAFAAKLNEIQAPADLGTKILGQVVHNADEVVEFPWWKQFSVLGAAASLFLVLGLVLLPIQEHSFNSSAMSVQMFQDFANQTLKTNNGFSSKAHDWGTLVKYLADHNTPAPATLPGKIDQMPPVGCMTLQLNEKPVGVICFGENSKSHLFVIDSQDFPQMPFKTSPLLEKSAFATSVYWSENDRHYLLLSHDPKELSRFVSF